MFRDRFQNNPTVHVIVVQMPLTEETANEIYQFPETAEEHCNKPRKCGSINRKFFWFILKQ